MLGPAPQAADDMGHVPVWGGVCGAEGNSET